MHIAHRVYPFDRPRVYAQGYFLVHVVIGEESIRMTKYLCACFIEPDEICFRQSFPNTFQFDLKIPFGVTKLCFVHLQPVQNRQPIPLLKCGGCKFARYCNKNCQRAAWESHKPECTAIKRVYPNKATDQTRLVARLFWKQKENARNGTKEDVPVTIQVCCIPRIHVN